MGAYLAKNQPAMSLRVVAPAAMVSYAGTYIVIRAATLMGKH